MKTSELEVKVWYVDARGRRLRALDFRGPKVRYEDDKGTVGDMDAKTFASRCVLKANPEPKE